MPRATWNEVDVYLRWKWRCGSLTFKSFAKALFAVFVGLLLVVALVFLRINF